jgi:predicted lipopolysaccharide heptosyltransferase III
MRTYRDYKNYSTSAKLMAWGIDLLGGIGYALIQLFVSLFRIFAPRHEYPQSKKVLLIRLDHLGDVLMTTPAIHTLKQHCPETSLIMLVSPSSYPVVDGNPDLDKIYTFKVPWFDGKRAQRFDLRAYLKLIRTLRQEQIDTAIDFRGDFRILFCFSWLSGARNRVGFNNLGGEFLLTTRCEYADQKHFVELNFDLIKSLGVPVNLHDIHYVLPTSAEDKTSNDRLFEELGITPNDIVVGIHPTTIPHWKLKRWQGERFAELADRLSAQYGTKVVLTGGAEELETISWIASLMKTTAHIAAGRTSFKQLAELMTRCRLFVANDTGPMHIAVAVHTPLVAIFGPTNPQKSGPYGNPERYRVVQHDVPCRRPCFVAECPRNHACMEAISVDQVFQACQSLLK